MWSLSRGSSAREDGDDRLNAVFTTYRLTRTARSFRAAAPLLVVLAWLCPAGCAERDETEADPLKPVTQEHEAGAYRLRVDCDRSVAPVAEAITLQLSVEHPADTRVIWPSVEGDWGGLAMTPTPSTDETIQGDAVARARKRYTLRALQSGEKTLGELTVRFRSVEESDDESDDLTSLTTRPIDFEIVSSLSGNEEPNTVLQADGTPVELPTDERFPWMLVGGGVLGAALLMAAGFWFLRWLRDREPPEVMIPAHRWALDELDRLASAALVERGEFHEFYFRLSGIVRGYIERRFGILAPEMTTEEFTEHLRTDVVLGEPHRRAMGPFLEACDLVKFARHVPGGEEADRALGSARDFVIDSADYGGDGPASHTPAEKAA